ncbi:MAG: hypothetical protein L6Q98_10185 [Anaerolineae bacterium]|nr:hypothetical protein [Anaerolineae bacterium]NUQ03169.1 hypothetical protein [Anaerolineae bacterium]
MIRTRWLMMIVMLWVGLTAFASRAQGDTLLIRSPSSRLSDDGRSIIVELDVRNDGNVATAASIVRLFDERGVELNSAPLMPLEPQTRASVVLFAPLDRLPPGVRSNLYITVGLDTLPGGTLTGRGNIASIMVNAPPLVEMPPAPLSTPTPTSILNIPLPVQVDLNDPVQTALAIGIAALCLLLLWVIWVIIRLTRSKPEPFGVWQPMYPAPAVIDPNTTDGRRYLWQQHAQSDHLPMPCPSGSVIARKLLIGAGGGRFDGWHIVGIRSGRYDQYGRINRTHHTMGRRAVRRLDRAARRRKLNEKAALGAARPVARALTKDILKYSDKRSAILPIAVDVRFKGERDLARMHFELWRCAGGEWQPFDSWTALPTYSSANDAVEQFGYSFYGQRHGESRRAFARRLEGDLTRVFAALVFKPAAPPAEEDTAGHPPMTEVRVPEAPSTARQRTVEPPATEGGTPVP